MSYSFEKNKKTLRRGSQGFLLPVINLIYESTLITMVSSPSFDLFIKKLISSLRPYNYFYLNESLFKMVLSKTNLTYKKRKGYLDIISVALKSYIVICFIFL